MTRPVTLFTGQWADLPLETVAKKAKEFGFDGLELACWGDHFDVQRALKEDGYAQGRRDLLAKYGLQVFAVSNQDPVSGANVMSRGIVGNRGEVPTVASPMFKQVYDLRTGTCLDDPTVSLPVYPVDLVDGQVVVGAGADR